MIGCGRISDIYLQNCRRFDGLEIVACASLDIAESRAKAAQHGIANACSAEEIFEDPSIDGVLNLTIPAAHADISLAALDAGKHVYAEKPFATSVSDGRKILDKAANRGLLVGNAPDTFLGGRWQTCRRLLDEGVIGRPTGVSAFVGTRGVERHHPNPDFYYQHGGGPLLDLGPYYLTAMVFLLGPIREVCGMSSRAFEKRLIESQPRAGQTIPVEVDTHVQSMLAFESGMVGSMTMSFDIWESATPRFEIYGENGTLCIPDPDPVAGANIFGGPVWYRTRETARWVYQPRRPAPPHWQEAHNRHGYNDNARGLGLLDLADAVRQQRAPRASGELALHILEVMEGILTSRSSGRYVSIETRCERPEPMPEQFPSSADGHQLPA